MNNMNNMKKSLDEFLQDITKNPSEIINNKYQYMSTMFPQEYIKALKVYINYLLKEISKKDSELKIYHIRSKL